MLLIFLGAGTSVTPPETRGRGGASDMPEDSGGSDTTALYTGGSSNSGQASGGAGDE